MRTDCIRIEGLVTCFRTLPHICRLRHENLQSIAACAPFSIIGKPTDQYDDESHF